MKQTFFPKLINGPFGDPGLYVSLRWEGRALLFDLGRIEALPATDIFKITHVFVSHAHIDHFIGFDHLLRLFLARDRLLSLFGPPPIATHVQGKLQGYSWNLVENYPFCIDVREVHPQGIYLSRFRARTGFRRENLSHEVFTGILVDDPLFTVYGVHLDHRIPCLAFCLAEKSHLNVNKDLLAKMGIPPGPWLAELKQAIREDRPDSWPVRPRWKDGGEERARPLTLGGLRQLVTETAGQKIVYVVDTLFNDENAAKIIQMASGADLFFCEAPFLEEDRAQARQRYHLTARQAGYLARAAGTRRLQIFHFSPRYAGAAQKLYEEAYAEFTGRDMIYGDGRENPSLHSQPSGGPAGDCR